MKAKINVIDVFIILTLILTLAGVGIRIYYGVMMENKNANHIITLQLNGVSVDNSNKLTVDEEA